jgi:hypothetical protein
MTEMQRAAHPHASSQVAVEGGPVDAYGGAGAERPKTNDIRIVKNVDKASTGLFSEPS